MTLSIQLWTMVAMIASGLGMGVVFDGYRVIAEDLRFSRWWLAVMDLLYWMAAAVIVFRILYAYNQGEIRAYIFVGLALGVVTHYWIFSKLVVKLTGWLLRMVRAIISFVWKVVTIVIIKPALLCYKLLKVIFGFGTAITLFLVNIVVQLVNRFRFRGKGKDD